MPEKPPSSAARRQERLRLLRQRIDAFDLICSGNLLKRTKVCGKRTCRCATDERQRHGPYWEWTWREHGRLVHRVVTPAQATALAAAIRNGRRVRALVALWERESGRIIQQLADANSNPNGS